MTADSGNMQMMPKGMLHFQFPRGPQLPGEERVNFQFRFNLRTFI